MPPLPRDPRADAASAPRGAAQVQWQPRGLRAELEFPHPGAADDRTSGVIAEVHRDVCSLAGWHDAPGGGRRIAWRLEVYADAPLPIGSSQAIAEALLGRAIQLAAAIDASRSRSALGAPEALALPDSAPTDDRSTTGLLEPSEGEP